MNASTERNIIRINHIIGATLIGAYIYSPLSNLEWFALLNQAVVVPLLSLSGIWMWKGQKIKKALKRKS